MSSTPDILPSSLTRDPKVDWSLSGANGRWFYLYCASCGADGGRVLDNYLPKQFAYYICETCLEKHGQVLGTYVEPDEVFRQKVVAAMEEEYGRVLTEGEILDELGNPSSLVSKLEKEGKGK